MFSFISPGIVEAGYGLTTTMIHEYGHHSSLSHPHDGYDSASGVDFEPTGDFFFAWLGDESNSMMSYIDVNWDFSQFDRDNGSKFKAAAYITNANAVAAMIAESRKAKLAADDLAEADALVGDVKAHVAAHVYGDAAAAAVDAYAAVRTARSARTCRCARAATAGSSTRSRSRPTATPTRASGRARSTAAACSTATARCRKADSRQGGAALAAPPPAPCARAGR